LGQWAFLKYRIGAFLTLTVSLPNLNNMILVFFLDPMSGEYFRDYQVTTFVKPARESALKHSVLQFIADQC
jgi:hypothetical protein